MKELAQVRQAVIDALNAGGVTAMEAFPADRAKRWPGAVAAVAVGAAEGKALGFCNYLGETYDKEAGTVRELYGKQLEGDIALELRAERAADCETGCAAATDILLGKLPSGIRPGELRWEALTWEKATGMLLRRGTLQCQAMFIARADEEGETFLDFILKGVIAA